MPTWAESEFEGQWKSADSPPDVFAFLTANALTDAEQQLPILLLDQRYRWRTASPLKVEEYLNRLPEFSEYTGAKLQLVLSEYELRHSHAQVPSMQEFIDRFSDLADTLRDRLSTEETLASGRDEDELTLIAEAPEELVGRYRLGRVLGTGAYGRVYLGFDDQLQRPVAVKVRNLEKTTEPDTAGEFLLEARLAASLDHPHIVPVHDVGQTGDGETYIVSKYIEGVTLHEKLRNGPLSFEECVRILIPVGEALHHAHQRRLIHRDVKPGNILIEESVGKPYVADFGLAVREQDFQNSGVIAGTPAYMSPEQARGEGHRLDGRGDLFALGAVFYLMLTGRRAFDGTTMNETLHQVVSEDPLPPGSVNSSVPRELERICQKALSKRVSGRHASVGEFVEELRQWQSEPVSRRVATTIVPRGLRSFVASDVEFFLDLLPGSRNRDGIPESVQFWRRRLLETDSESTFRVGLIYGPSGCGKSSLIKAAVLPHGERILKCRYAKDLR